MDKAFTLSVQSKCANCTSVYKAAYLEGFEMLLKKLLTHLLFLRGTFLISLRTHSLDEITDGGRDDLEKITKVIVLNINLL